MLTLMSGTDVAQILKLPAQERMRLVELICESLAADPAAMPLGDAQREVIDERLAEHEHNPNDVATRDEILAETRRR